jgi:hypothetical protein
MKEDKKHQNIGDRIISGMDIVYERLLAYKKEKNSYLVVMDGNKIVLRKPE